MVSSKTLQNIHKRLWEIFGCHEANPFVGKTILLFGDRLYLPSITSQHVFVPLCSLFATICNIWSKL